MGECSCTQECPEECAGDVCRCERCRRTWEASQDVAARLAFLEAGMAALSKRVFALEGKVGVLEAVESPICERIAALESRRYGPPAFEGPTYRG